MDNYFTLPQVIKRLREKGIGVIGMARMRKGWPPQALRKTKNECNFNNFRHLVDDNSTLVATWMDNGLKETMSDGQEQGTCVTSLG
eukprot:459599-Ditylum_brightwellii.AAC.1